MKIIEFTDGSRVTANQFKIQNTRLQYAGDFPSAVYLASIGASIVEVSVAVTLNDVKSEANKRIVALVPEWKQRNLTAQAAVLAKVGEGNWTTEQTSAWNAGEIIWGSIQAIRTASDVIEAIDPIPQDYKDDSRWPVS
jgi:hypothetical protein